jgi:hypothetical protein
MYIKLTPLLRLPLVEDCSLGLSLMRGFTVSRNTFHFKDSPLLGSGDLKTWMVKKQIRLFFLKVGNNNNKILSHTDKRKRILLKSGAFGKIYHYKHRVDGGSQNC